MILFTATLEGRGGKLKKIIELTVHVEERFGMEENLLEIKNLWAKAGDKEILRGLTLAIKKGGVHVILGPNGSGKSTLMNVIMGHPKYEVTEGNIFFEGEDISSLKTYERARRGLFLSFQTPEEIFGVTVENMLRTAKNAVTGQKARLIPFRKELRAMMDELKIDREYSARYLNVGFSGGEKKKSEILQLLTLNPKLALLDETDSGLDVDAVQIVSQLWKESDNGWSLPVLLSIGLRGLHSKRTIRRRSKAWKVLERRKLLLWRHQSQYHLQFFG